MRASGDVFVRVAAAAAMAFLFAFLLSPTRAPAQGVSCYSVDPEIANGLDEGFGAPPMQTSTSVPSSPQSPSPLQAPRLVFLLTKLPNEGGAAVVGFKAWLDGDVCPLRVPGNLDDESKMDASFAKQVVLGTILRGDGRVRIALRARTLASGAETEEETGEAEGEDKAAVAAATHQALKRLGLVCEG
jgi:hypothetical protein